MTIYTQHSTSTPEQVIKAIDRYLETPPPMPRLFGMQENNRVNSVVAELYGNKDMRQGAKPSIASDAYIREVVGKSIKAHKPIPIMVPWGSEKPDSALVDVAEVSALKSLEALQDRVQMHYSLGLEINIGIEDVSAPHLFFETPRKARNRANMYSRDLVNLISILQLSHFIRGLRESSLTTEEIFNKVADRALELIEPYVREADQAKGIVVASENHQKLTDYGWKGDISFRQIEDYITRCSKLYEGKSRNDMLHIMARYYAGALAREKLSLRINPDWTDGYLSLSFVPPVVGTEDRFKGRLYYKPTIGSSRCIPPWRAKGLFIYKDGEVFPTIRPRYNVGCNYLPNTVKLEDRELGVWTSIEADVIGAEAIQTSGRHEVLL